MIMRRIITHLRGMATIITHLRGMTTIRRIFPVTTVVSLDTLELIARKRRNSTMIRRSRITTQMRIEATLHLKVSIIFLYALNLYLLLLFQIVGL